MNWCYIHLPQQIGLKLNGIIEDIITQAPQKVVADLDLNQSQSLPMSNANEKNTKVDEKPVDFQSSDIEKSTKGLSIDEKSRDGEKI